MKCGIELDIDTSEGVETRTCAMLETARGHSDGCRALRTNTRTRMSAERGARSGGGAAEDKSQTEAVIVPHGGDMYSVLCFDDRLNEE